MENAKCLIWLCLSFENEKRAKLCGTHQEQNVSFYRVVPSLHLFHQLSDDMQPFLRNDPQQSHQVFMLQLPEKEKVKNTKYHVIGGF